MRKIFFGFLLVRNFKSLGEKVVKKINGLTKFVTIWPNIKKIKTILMIVIRIIIVTKAIMILLSVAKLITIITEIIIS